jgi:hypothetical protein
MQTSLLLLRDLSAALGILQHRSADITLDRKRLVLEKMLIEQRLPELLAQLLMWLQQRPELLHLEPTSTTAAAAEGAAAAAAAAAQQPVSNAMLWQECLACVASIAIMVDGFVLYGNADLADRFTWPLIETGELQLQQCLNWAVSVLLM